MNLNELKPVWRRYSDAVAAAEKRTADELNGLLPVDLPVASYRRRLFMLRNAAMFVFIAVGCGGC